MEMSTVVNFRHFSKCFQDIFVQMQKCFSQKNRKYENSHFLFNPSPGIYEAKKSTIGEFSALVTRSKKYHASVPLKLPERRPGTADRSKPPQPPSEGPKDDGGGGDSISMESMVRKV
jgi:hypothetical protein